MNYVRGVLVGILVGFLAFWLILFVMVNLGGVGPWELGLDAVLSAVIGVWVGRRSNRRAVGD